MLLFQDIKIIIVITIINFSLLFYLQYKSKDNTLQSKLSNYIISFIFAVAMSLSFIPPEILTNFNKLSSFQGVFFGGSLIFFIYFFSYLQLFLLSTVRTNEVKSKTYFWLYATLFVLISTIYVYAYYPGIFFPDSINQWDQIQTVDAPWNDWHPVGHTFIMMITSLGKYPIGFIVFQIIIYSFTMAYFCDFLRNLVGNKLANVFFLFFLITPIFPLYSIYIVKDSLFTYCLVLLTLYLTKIILTHGEWLNKKYNLVFLFFTLLGFVFFRHNGWPALIVSTVILSVFLFRKKFIKLFFIVGLVIISYQVVTGPVYDHFDIIRSDPTESFGVFIQITAGIINDEGSLSKDEIEYFETLMPKKDWKDLYEPNNVDAIKFKERFNKQIIKDDPPKFLMNVFRITIKNPKIALKAYAKQIEILWHSNISLSLDNLRPIFRRQMEGQVGPYYFMTREQRERISPNYKGMNLDKFTRKKNSVRIVLLDILNWIEYSKLYIFLMPASHFILVTFSMIMLLIKKRAKLILAFIPYFLVIGSMFVAIPAQDIRYAFISLFMGVLGICIVKGDLKEGSCYY